MTTEWDSIQARFGNAPQPTPAPPPAIIRVSEDRIAELAVSTAEKKRQEKPSEEDDLLDEEDREAFERYRLERLGEIRRATDGRSFGSVVSVGASDYVSEVTEASRQNWVVVVLWEQSSTACDILLSVIGRLATKFPLVKFVSGRADQVMAGNPPRDSLPITLVYHGGEVVHREVGISSFGGSRATADDVEWALSKIGVLETDLSEPPTTTVPGRFVVHVAKKNPTSVDTA